MSTIRMVVGLGNPGREYEATRHNVGFMVLDRLAAERGVRFELNNRWECAVAKLADDDVLLVKPLAFMNLSGRAVGKVVRFFHWLPHQALIVYDDAALDLGRIRIREKGSHGGHNGIRSLIEHLGTEVFPRIKLGIGSKDDSSMAGHVLGKFMESEQESLQNMLAMAKNAVQDSLSRGVATAAHHYNTIGNQTLKKSNEQEI